MPNYRRNYQPGCTFFFTVVTASRQPIFKCQGAVNLLRQCIADEQRVRPFTIDAAVVLWDHVHMIWTLPPGDAQYSMRWSAVKAAFTRTWICGGGQEVSISNAKANQRYRGVWQPRFLEHTCRDTDDLANHIDYIHFNPVKHGYVKRPVDWPYSSIHRYVEWGILSEHWGTSPDLTYGQDVDQALLE